jgi:hypothetical protein
VYDCISEMEECHDRQEKHALMLKKSGCAARISTDLIVAVAKFL